VFTLKSYFRDIFEKDKSFFIALTLDTVFQDFKLVHKNLQ